MPKFRIVLLFSKFKPIGANMVRESFYLLANSISLSEFGKGARECQG